MKKLVLFFVGLLTFGTALHAAENTFRRGTVYDGSKYIFTENGIEFSVFPDGEFDFYIPQYVSGVSIGVNTGPLNISFNTGYNYDAWVQYDDFGAVVQIENTPIYYDAYGRIIQAGDVFINYRNNRIVNVGGLNIFYNNYGIFSHSTGFINVYNRYYVPRVWHAYYYRPVFNRCLVWTTPYRRFYTPVRYNYAFHRRNYARGYYNGYRNARRDFRRPETGRVAHNNGRRDAIDRNRGVSRSNSRSRDLALNDNSRGRRNTVNRGEREIKRERTSRKSNANTVRGDRRNNRANVVRGDKGNSRPQVNRGPSRDTKPRAAKPRTQVKDRGTSKRSVSKKTTRSTRSVAPRSSRSTQKASRSQTSSRSKVSKARSTSRSKSARSSNSRSSRARRGL